MHRAVKVHCLEWFKDLWLQVYKQTHGKYIQNNQVAIISSPKAPIQINLVPADLFFLINSSGGPWLAFTWFVTLWQKLVRCFFILYLHVTSLEKKIKVIRRVIVHWNIHGMFNHISRLFLIGFKTKYVYGSALERRPVFNA